MKPLTATPAKDITYPHLTAAAFDTVWTVRPDMSTAEFAEVAEVVIVDDEARAALISLWDRRDRLTAAERSAIEAILAAGTAGELLALADSDGTDLEDVAR